MRVHRYVYIFPCIPHSTYANSTQETTEPHTQQPRKSPTPPSGPTAAPEPSSGSAATAPMPHPVMASGEFIVHIMNWSVKIQIN